MNRQWHLDARRIVALGAFVGVVAALATVDGLVATMVGVLIVAVYAVVRWRGPRRLRRIAIGTTALVSLSGVLVALALPVYAQRPAALIVNQTPDRSVAVPLKSLGINRPSFEVLGYVASDYEDSSTGVDVDASRVTALAPTGVSLGSAPGTLEVADPSDTLVRAHAQGTRALLVVSNYDGTDFNGTRVEQLLANRDATSKFTSALTSLVAKKGWDGVVIDFENLTPAVRSSFPALIRSLDDALGSRTVDVAVPAFTDPTDPDLAAYDLTAIAHAADRVTWMAYDEHEIASGPGPVASVDWVNRGLDLALARMPASKVLLGVASYGYAWKLSASGHASAGTEYSSRDAQTMAFSTQSPRHWDAATGEWTGALRDGRIMWYSDGRSMAVRAQIAVNRHLGGVALWRVGADEPGALDQLPASAKRSPAIAATSTGAGGRTIQDVRAGGVVALTFDDGPDPRWTPKILTILQREHVPATFFVIGQEAQAHPSLLRAEVRSGDIVGNHTYSHKNLSKTGSLSSHMEILGGSAVIEGITGHAPALFRSPYGAGDRSAHGIGGDQLANDLGEHAVAWNVDPLDWAKPGVSVIETRVQETTRERAIVLLHDGGGDRSQTIAALPSIIEHLKSRGYLFTTVDGIDGSISSPYRTRSGLFAASRGVAIVAGFRLWVATRRAFLLILVVIAGLSVLRLVVSAPLALLQARRHRRWRRQGVAKRDVGQPWPKVTIAVPAHNEATVIAKTIAALQSLHHPDGPDSLEILVIDDGSTDNTAEVARLAAPGPVSTRVICQPASKKAGALNRAFGEANGEIVIVVDADTVVDSGLVAAMLPHFDDETVGAVAGNVKVGNQHSLFGKLQSLEYVVSLNLDRRAQAAANVMAVVPGAAGAFRRSAVLGVGGYSTDTLVEDADLTVMLLADGWRVPYEPLAIAYTEAPQTLKDVVRQRRRWAFGTVEVLLKHRHRLLARKGGRIGFIGLPWMLITQVVLPLVGPASEVFLLYLLMVHNLGEAGGIVAIAVISDIVISAFIVLANREPLRMIAYVPLLRLVWRPLQLYAIAASTTRWLSGQSDGWRKVTRYNTVDARIGAALPQQ